eukprot:maker-scaffold631_size122145-snap-gene-0.45 protein:Tk01062 transcript:maker-scaffold631_size122145-snap-gene-0.45-mRNA-1 annotation:"dna polymerase subunit gamma-1 isoform x1"
MWHRRLLPLPRIRGAPTLATNAFGIRLVPESVRQQLFLGQPGGSQSEHCTAERVQGALGALRKFGLKPEPGPDQARRSSLDSGFPVEIPPLYGDVDSHFYRIALEQVQPYESALTALLAAELVAQPTQWLFESGWTRYEPGQAPVAVAHPLELGALVFDVEVCVRDGPHPVMATALTDRAWYGWCSPHLVQGTRPERVSVSDLIPLGASRLVIGHNVSYDRARCATEYTLEGTDTRFLDTMSLHIVVNGMTSGQRMMKQKNTKDVASDTPPLLADTPKWMAQTSLNNLRDVYQFYCQGQLSKDIRNVFVTGELEEIRADFQNLMAYCARDVEATLQISRKLFPLFKARCPHPVSLSGMLEMGSAFLPISPRWERYLQEANETAFEVEQEMHTMLARLTEEAVQLIHDDRYQADMWLWDLDWSRSRLRLKQDKRKAAQHVFPAQPNDDRVTQLKKKFSRLFGSSEQMANSQPRRPGYPKWFQELLEPPAKGGGYPVLTELTASKKIVPKILRLMWMGNPLHRHDSQKWGFIVRNPDDGTDAATIQDLLDGGRVVFPIHKLQDLSQADNTGERDNDLFVTEPIDYSCMKHLPPKPVKPATDPELEMLLEEIPGGKFVRLPHKNGKAHRVGSPLSKDFLSYVKDDVLCSESKALASRVLMAAKSCSYWKSSQDRITSQMVVDIPGHGSSSAIVPLLVTSGTLTRRAVERTWLTASNAKPDRIGSEFKALVEAPPGYCLVGADVDSQELWIAAVLGDANSLGEHGCTPLGWMTLQGTKADGTDMHSVTAKTVGVSRDNAKILNYGRIYGAGLNFASHLLQQFNPSLDESQAQKLAARIYVQTKGDRVYRLNDVGAKCMAVLLKGRGHNGITSDIETLRREVVSKQDLKEIIRIRRVWRHIVASETDGDTFHLTEDGQILALNVNDVTDGSEVDFPTLADIINAIGSYGNVFLRDQSWRDIKDEVTSRPSWSGGTESDAFNRLEDIALSFSPKTPVLECQISRALESSMVGSGFLPSRINWVVQSSAVDYLHLLLVAMKWLIVEFNIDARFVISIHDEVRYLVKEEDTYRAALALQISNVLVRALFASQLGMNSLPESVAFFSGVDIDQVLRKDPFSDCVTPSNPQGLALGHGIPLGRSLTIEELVQAGKSVSRELLRLWAAMLSRFGKWFNRGQNEGIQSVQTSPAFKTLNFELYSRPRPFVAGIGTIIFLSCCGYLFVLRQDPNRTVQYNSMDGEGNIQRKEKPSRWD